MAEAAKDEADDLVIVSDDPKVFEGEEGAPAPKAKVEPDEDEDEEDDEEETRLGAAEGDEDKDELHKRRKEERSQRRERQKQARERDSKEMTYLRRDNERMFRELQSVTGRVTNVEVSGIDREISNVKANLMTADNVISKAISAGKGEDAAEAMRIRDGLRDRLNTLTNAKTTLASRSESEGGGGEQQPRRGPPQALLDHAKAWTDKHSWWDPNGGDEDSLVVSAIDTALVNEGLDPKTKAYWDELTKRVNVRLPHRAPKSRRDDDEDEDENETSGRERTKSRGPRFRTQGRERPLKKNEVYISPDRKAAMVDAGVWDDPVLRQKFLKQYAAWDKENANA